MDVPIRFLPTQTIAPGTFLVRQLIGEGMGPVAAPLNTMVIRGAEPVLVDTGASLTSQAWMEETFSIVDPADVRWVFLSHDDTDHTGSLFEVLERCPQATLVTNWFSVQRIAADRLLPLHRLRIANPGESFSAGDRTLTAVVPPVYDSPTTRGLHDERTGVYWGADAFALLVPGQVDDVGELDAGFVRDGFLQEQRMLSPWVQWLDPARYQGYLREFGVLGASVGVGAHGVALRGARSTWRSSSWPSFPTSRRPACSPRPTSTPSWPCSPRRPWPPDQSGAAPRPRRAGCVRGHRLPGAVPTPDRRLSGATA